VSSIRATSRTVRAPVHHTPFLDRAQNWLWPLQVANIRVMRAIRVLPTLLLGLLVLWALVAWRPWQYANTAIEENTEWTFRLNPYWTTFIAVFAVLVIPWLAINLLPSDNDARNPSKRPSATILIGFRYVVMQLLSDPVGTLVIFAIPIIAGLDPFFWNYPKPWYWKPSTWDWRRIVLTIACMFVVYIISRGILLLIERSAAKRKRKPPWLVLWRKLVLIALVLPDKYSAADRSPTVTGDHFGLAEVLPAPGSRQIGVSPITSPFGSLSRYPTAKLRTRPAFAKDWADYEQLIVRLNQLLANLAPWRLELQYVHNLSPWGYLIIHFSSPVAADASSLIPGVLIGPADPAHEHRGLTIEENIRRRAPGSDPLDETPGVTAVHEPERFAESPDLPVTQELNVHEDGPDVSHSWVSAAEEQLFRELHAKDQDSPEGEAQ